MKIIRQLIAGMMLVLMTGCGVEQTLATPQAASSTSVQITETAQPASTPTKKVYPTFTPRPTAVPRPLSDADERTFKQNERIGRAVNLGNALEAPKEGEWGVVLEERYFDLIQGAGFTAVRVPIRWSNHALKEAPYTIDESFFERVDWVVENALERNLVVILNMHHYEEIFKDPARHTERFVAMWQQIAERYQGQPDGVYFEFLNEPNGSLNPLWNILAFETLTEVRKTNPDRTVVLGPADWNSLFQLETLTLPEDDRNIIVTFHYYLPFKFTHQGADWAAGSEGWLGTKWPESENSRNMIRANFRAVSEWGKKNGRPIFLGEFGAYREADMESRTLWTEHVARTAEEFGFSWSYWEFCSVFGVYDLETDSWNKPLIEALFP